MCAIKGQRGACGTDLKVSPSIPCLRHITVLTFVFPLWWSRSPAKAGNSSLILSSYLHLNFNKHTLCTGGRSLQGEWSHKDLTFLRGTLDQRKEGLYWWEEYFIGQERLWVYRSRPIDGSETTCGCQQIGLQSPAGRMQCMKQVGLQEADQLENLPSKASEYWLGSGSSQQLSRDPHPPLREAGLGGHTVSELSGHLASPRVRGNSTGGLELPETLLGPFGSSV